MSNLGPRPLQPGTTIEWVSRHLDLGIAETLEKAKADGIKLNDKTLYSTRHVLKKKYGGGKAKKKGIKTAFVVEHVNQPDEAILKKAKAKKIALSKHDLQKIRWTLKNGKGKKKKGKAPTAKSDMPEKEAQVRKLFFELGFDTVTRIYNEFSSLHGQMR